MTDTTRIAELILKKIEGEITSVEAKELDEWIDASPDNKVFMETRMTPEAIARKQQILRDMDVVSLDRRLDKILSKNRKGSRLRSNHWATK